MTPAISPAAALVITAGSPPPPASQGTTFGDIFNDAVPTGSAAEAVIESATQNVLANDARVVGVSVSRPDIAVFTASIADAVLPDGDVSDAKSDEPAEDSNVVTTQLAEVAPNLSAAVLIAAIAKAVAPRPGTAAQAGDDARITAKSQTALAQIAVAMPMADDMPDIATATASAPVAAFQPVHSPAVTTPDVRQLYVTPDKQWIDTLRREIVSSSARDNHLQFTLKPEHLGRLDIVLTTQDGKVDIQFDASTSAAAQILATEKQQLIADLRQAGVKVGQFEMTNGQDGARQQQRHRQDAQTPDPHPTPNRNMLSKQKRGRFA